MNFQFFYLITEYAAGATSDDWRQKYVWHFTPSGRRTKVKVKSLPPDEQYRYAPLEVKLKRKLRDPHVKIDGPSQPVSRRVLKFYYSADRDGGFDSFEGGKLVIATDDSAKAIEIEKSGHVIAVAHNVPMGAIRKFWNYESGDWEAFDKDISDEKKYELIKFTKNDVYAINFYKYKDEIDFQLSDQTETDEEGEQ